MKSVCALGLVVMASARLLPGPRAAPRAPTDSDALRIFQGVDDFTADAGKYAYVVALLYMNVRQCTGTLLTSQWVLTAAHCYRVDSIQYGNMTVSPKNITTKSKLLKYIPHQNFRAILTPGETQCDIGMLLVESVPLEVFGKLTAVDYRAMTGHPVTFVGYGITKLPIKLEELRNDMVRALQLAEGVVVSCKANYGYVTPCMCVAPRCEKAQYVLPGDSGGPIFLDGKVAGVAHAVISNPGISMYMPVSPYLTWIQQVMEQEEQRKINIF